MTEAVAASVYDAHDYEPLSKAADPHGNGTDCKCSPACKVCGSAKGAFIHSKEGAEAGATVVVREVAAGDVGSARERAKSG
jgi:hypothetical protein